LAWVNEEKTMQIAQNNNAKFIIGGLIIALLAVIAIGVLNMPDRRSPGEKIGDAVGKLDNGVDDAARELQDRTPAQRIGDSIDDATDGSPQ
jgi:hypothetical protein